jgi:hypothetical protein
VISNRRLHGSLITAVVSNTEVLKIKQVVV